MFTHLPLGIHGWIQAEFDSLPAPLGFPDLAWARPPVLADGTADQGRASS